MRYCFADCQLDTQLYTLHRAGTQRQLRPKVFQLLMYLLEHRDRVISKQELAEQLWPEQYIRDAVVENTIRAVRQIVGDSGRSQQIIQTLPGHGYRFIAPVSESTTAQYNDDATPTVPVVDDTAAGDHSSDASPLATRSHASAVDLPTACRRQLTVLCCDLVDAVKLAKQLDLEAHRDVMQAYREACLAVIQRFDGYVAQNGAGGTMVYFGYPQAHEDDARRAVCTGLGLLEALQELNSRLACEQGLRLVVRLGIHTGLAVVDDRPTESCQDHIAFGETPHIALQLRSLAPPDTVVISAATARLVQDMFVSHSLEMPRSEDLADIGPLCRVIRAREAQSRFQVALHKGVRPLVGRTEEMSLLRRRWETASNGNGQAVWLCGEAGIGKSRLTEALRAQVQQQTGRFYVFRCTPDTQQSPLYPVLAYMQQCLQWRQDDDPATKLTVLEKLVQVSRLQFPLEEAIPLLATLYGVPLEARYMPLSLPPEALRQKTLDLLITWLIHQHEEQPILMVCEDLHWADPTTLELLGQLLDQLPMMPLLALMTYRPTFRPPWASRSYVTQLTLNGLPACEIQQMMADCMDGQPVPKAVLHDVIAKSDGVPLFVEEFVQMIRENGSEYGEVEHGESSNARTTLPIPTTLHEILMARLDYHDSAREIAQLCAVLGRTCDYEVLRAVAPMEEAALQRGLAQLVDAELLYQRGLPPMAHYHFKHALIQETAYHSLLERTRQPLHQRIAEVLVAQFPGIAEAHPERVAQHFANGGFPEQAMAYWYKAAQQAIQRHAYAEARQLCRLGLETLTAAAPMPQGAQHELAFQFILGTVLVASKGFADDEVECAYTRALELSRQLGDTTHLFPILGGLRSLHFVRGDLHTARSLAEQQLDLAEQQQEPTLLMHAHTHLGAALFYQGELAAAQAHLTEVSSHDAKVRSPTPTALRDPRVYGLAHAALTLVLLGYAEQALERSQQAITLAHEMSQPFSVAFTLGMNAIFHHVRREPTVAQSHVEALLALSEAHGFTTFMMTGSIFQRLLQVTRKQAAKCLAQIHKDLYARRAAGIEALFLVFLLQLAEGYGKVGRATVGLTVLAEAHTIMEEKGEYAFAAELHRMRGELVLQHDIACGQEAERCYQQALDIARRQDAKWWELRTAVSLSQLWQSQGKPLEAHRVLADVYSWFTEGLDTPDLQRAKATLVELV